MEASSSLKNPLRFPGQYFDAETGLHYNYFRDYDPSTGRYIESDPIGLDGGINTYTYALDNPQKYIDPYGQNVLVVCGTASAADGPAPIGEIICICYAAYRGIRFAYNALSTITTMSSEESCEDNRNCPKENESEEDEPADPLDDYPADPDDWTPPDGWTETSAGEETGGRHRQWRDPNGNMRRRWDREGDPVRQPGLGPHWWDSRFPKKHIPPKR